MLPFVCKCATRSISDRVDFLFYMQYRAHRSSFLARSMLATHIFNIFVMPRRTHTHAHAHNELSIQKFPSPFLIIDVVIYNMRLDFIGTISTILVYSRALKNEKNRIIIFLYLAGPRERTLLFYLNDRACISIQQVIEERRKKNCQITMTMEYLFIRVVIKSVGRNLAKERKEESKFYVLDFP